MAVKTTIKNNIVTIERFKFKVAGFRMRFEGETSLDGKLNLKMRLGLPPLGILGIPIKISGTQEQPVIKIGSKSEDLEATEYDADEAPIPSSTVSKDSIPEVSFPKTEPPMPLPEKE